MRHETTSRRNHFFGSSLKGMYVVHHGKEGVGDIMVAEACDWDFLDLSGPGSRELGPKPAPFWKCKPHPSDCSDPLPPLTIHFLEDAHLLEPHQQLENKCLNT